MAQCLGVDRPPNVELGGSAPVGWRCGHRAWRAVLERILTPLTMT
jgi:hypothetical protein